MSVRNMRDMNRSLPTYTCLGAVRDESWQYLQSCLKPKLSDTYCYKWFRYSSHCAYLV